MIINILTGTMVILLLLCGLQAYITLLSRRKRRLHGVNYQQHIAEQETVIEKLEAKNRRIVRKLNSLSEECANERF